MKSVKYLRDVKEKYSLTSATAIAEKLGLSKQAVSNYLNENRVMDEETCLAVALALDINPVEVMMAAGIDRAAKTGQRSLWEVFSKRMATATASAITLAAVTLFLTPPPADAANMRIAEGGTSGNINYANIGKLQLELRTQNNNASPLLKI